jgi:hypothetical protein
MNGKLETLGQLKANERYEGVATQVLLIPRVELEIQPSGLCDEQGEPRGCNTKSWTGLVKGLDG